MASKTHNVAAPAGRVVHPGVLMAVLCAATRRTSISVHSEFTANDHIAALSIHA